MLRNYSGGFLRGKEEEAVFISIVNTNEEEEAVFIRDSITNAEDKEVVIVVVTRENRGASAQHATRTTPTQSTVRA